MTGENDEPLATPPGPATGMVAGETHIGWDACNITINGVHCTNIQQAEREIWRLMPDIAVRQGGPSPFQQLFAWLRRRNHA